MQNHTLTALALLGAPAAAQVAFPFDSATYSAPAQPSGVAAVDLDADGALDLVYTHQGSGRVSVRLNHGDGSFADGAPLAHVPGASGLALGDLNGDALVDLAVLSDSADRVALFFGLGGAAFAPAGEVLIAGDLVGLELADLDGDGLDELLVCDSSTPQLRIAPNLGAGGFGALTSVPLHSPAANVEVGDLDNDGWADLIASTGYGGWGSVAMGGPALAFQPPGYLPSSYGGGPIWVALGEVNGDGLLDLFTSEDDGFDVDIVVWPGKGDGSFGPELWYSLTTDYEIRQTPGDFNGDGRLDLALVPGLQDVAGWAGDGTGVFWQDAAQGATGSAPSDLFVADLDGDGADDVVTANAGSNTLTVLLSRPETVSSYHDSFHALSSGWKVHHMALQAGPAHAGQLYLVLGSASGTTPGLLLGGQHLPLNFDAYTQYSLVAPGTLIQGSLGLLDAAGAGAATLDLGWAPLPPQASGLVLNHAFVVLDPVTAQVQLISEALTLTIL